MAKIQAFLRAVMSHNPNFADVSTLWQVEKLFFEIILPKKILGKVVTFESHTASLPRVFCEKFRRGG